MTDFMQRLEKVQADRHSVLCVGLDPDLERLPAHLLEGRSPAEAVIAFNRAIIEATASAACAYKLNLAFYEALGREGWQVLEETLDAIPTGLLTLADGKRGDIGNSARFYAEAVFDRLGFDACTVSPYMGRDSVEPFLAYAGKAAFILVRTTNPGAAAVQQLVCSDTPFFLHVAHLAEQWAADTPGTAGFVAGATDPGALKILRADYPTAPFLIPGIGAQHGNPATTMQAAAGGPVLISSSRSILYASDDEDFADASAHAAEALRTELEDYRGSRMEDGG